MGDDRFTCRKETPPNWKVYGDRTNRNLLGAKAARPFRSTYSDRLGGSRLHCHLSSTILMPAKTRLIFARDNLPTHSVSIDLSRATVSETFATESFGRPVSRAAISTFPGASAHFRLLVSGTHRTVTILLRLKGSPCTTITGLRNPVPEPNGSWISAHQISPWEITNQPGPVFA